MAFGMTRVHYDRPPEDPVWIELPHLGLRWTQSATYIEVLPFKLNTKGLSKWDVTVEIGTQSLYVERARCGCCERSATTTTTAFY